MSDVAWASTLVTNVARCQRSGNNVERFRLIERAREEAKGSEVRRGILLMLEIYMPELDGEVGARAIAERLVEKLKAAPKVLIEGNVTQGAHGTIGDRNE